MGLAGALAERAGWLLSDMEVREKRRRSQGGAACAPGERRRWKSQWK